MVSDLDAPAIDALLRIRAVVADRSVLLRVAPSDVVLHALLSAGVTEQLPLVDPQ